MTHAPRLPEFPTFKHLEPGDRQAVERITANHPPYSDFNFVSLWCWDIGETCQLSRLGRNLVVCMKDYLSDESVLSFVGDDAVEDTITALLGYGARRGLKPELRLVPESVVRAEPLSARIAVSEEPGSFDYVLSTDEWVALSGKRFRNKRNAVHRVDRTPDVEFRPLGLGSFRTQEQIMAVFRLWSDKRRRTGFEETGNELLAIRRSFRFGLDPDVVCFGVFIAGVLRGFSINEVVAGGYAVGHFWKADPAVAGLYPYLLHHTCRSLRERGCRFINIEQDLGQHGLATSKHLLRPHHLLRKYTITASTVRTPTPPLAEATPASFVGRG